MQSASRARRRSAEGTATTSTADSPEQASSIVDIEDSEPAATRKTRVMSCAGTGLDHLGAGRAAATSYAADARQAPRASTRPSDSPRPTLWTSRSSSRHRRCDCPAAARDSIDVDEPHARTSRICHRAAVASCHRSRARDSPRRRSRAPPARPRPRDRPWRTARPSVIRCLSATGSSRQANPDRC